MRVKYIKKDDVKVLRAGRNKLSARKRVLEKYPESKIVSSRVVSRPTNLSSGLYEFVVSPDKNKIRNRRLVSNRGVYVRPHFRNGKRVSGYYRRL